MLSSVTLSEQASADAHSTPQLFYAGEHLIVDSSNRRGREYLARLTAGRPTPLEPQTPIEAGSTVGNVIVNLKTGPDSCGSKSSTRLVLCFDGNGNLSASDRLLILAFVSSPTEIRVPTEQARQYLANLLTAAPGAAQDAIHISTTPCTDACARQIRLERRS
jgi:hypothetical protein